MNVSAIQISPLIKLAQALLVVQAGIWLVFSLWMLVRPSTPSTFAIILAAMMFINQLIFLGIVWGISRRLKAVFFFALVFLSVNLSFSVTDEFGIFDWLVLALDVIMLVILVWIRRYFTGKVSCLLILK